MKRYLLLLVVSVFPILVMSQDKPDIKKFEKYLKEYDIELQSIENLDRNHPEQFWDEIWRKNKRLMKVYEAAQKNTKLFQETQKCMNKAKVAGTKYINSLRSVEELSFVADTISKYIGLKEIFPDATYSVVEDNYVNAFAYPDGRIYFTDGLLGVKGIRYAELLGIAAHETAHFVLQHTLLKTYGTLKKYRKNAIIAGVASGLNAAATAYAQANGVADENSWEKVQETTDNLFEAAFYDATGRFRYKYNRELEIEADIIAYRFLEWTGIGGHHYINALKLIGDDNEVYTQENDHPTTEFRIALLEYLEEKEIGDTITIEYAE